MCGRVVDCSAEGFALAMDGDVHSLLRLIRRAEHLMPHGCASMTAAFYGSETVVEHYHIVGALKTARESTGRRAAAELGAKGIAMHALSPGKLKPRAATGIAEFDALLDEAAARADPSSRDDRACRRLCGVPREPRGVERDRGRPRHRRRVQQHRVRAMRASDTDGPARAGLAAEMHAVAGGARLSGEAICATMS